MVDAGYLMPATVIMEGCTPRTRNFLDLTQQLLSADNRKINREEKL
jgi:hypothetical protein